jgi:hypothetical protein
VVPVEYRDREEERGEYPGECEWRLGLREKFDPGFTELDRIYMHSPV